MIMNNVIKDEYYEWEREINKRSDRAIARTKRAIDLFELFIDGKDFSRLTRLDIKRFKKNLAKRFEKKTNRPVTPLVEEYICATIRRFLIWLFVETDYNSELSFEDLEILRITRRGAR